MSTMAIVVALVALASTPATASAMTEELHEELQEKLHNTVDARAAGAGEAGHVIFGWAMPGSAAVAYALVAASPGGVDEGKSTAAWGLWSEGNVKKTGGLSAQRQRELRSAASGSLLVRVDAAQLDQVSALLREWSSREPGQPDQDCENLVYRVIPILGIKAPYRPGFGAGDPYALLRDLTRLNR